MEETSGSTSMISTTERSRRKSRRNGPSIPKKLPETDKNGLPFVFEADILKEPLGFSDVLIDFIFTLRSGRMRLWMKRVVLFLLSGFLHKIWMWFTSCILLWYDAPCDPKHNIFTMPFVFTSLVSEHEWTSPYFFSFLDLGHCVLSVYASVLIYCIIKILKKCFGILYSFYDKIKLKFQVYKHEARRRKIQRRNEVRNNAQKKKND